MGAFISIAFNVLSISALPENTTDWNWGCGPYPEGYYDNEGYPIDNNNCNYELTDDDLNESDELEDEQEHEEESRDED